MRDPGHENTMYMLRSKSVNYVSAYPLRIRVSAYPLQSTLRLFLGEGWSSPLRIRVSAYPLQTTLRLFHVSTLFREAPLKWQGILQLLCQMLSRGMSLEVTKVQKLCPPRDRPRKLAQLFSTLDLCHLFQSLGWKSCATNDCSCL